MLDCDQARGGAEQPGGGGECPIRGGLNSGCEGLWGPTLILSGNTEACDSVCLGCMEERTCWIERNTGGLSLSPGTCWLGDLGQVFSQA